MQKQFLLATLVLTPTVPACTKTTPATPTPVPIGSEAIVDDIKIAVTSEQPVIAPRDEVLSAK